MQILKYWLPVLGWAGVIFTFSTLQVTPSSEFYWQDFLIKKTAHLVEYGVLFMLLFRAFLNTTKMAKKQAAYFSIIIVVLYGLSDEYHQSFTPGREPNLRDVFIDGIGGLIAWGIIWKYLPIAPEKLKRLARALQIL